MSLSSRRGALKIFSVYILVQQIQISGVLGLHKSGQLTFRYHQPAPLGIYVHHIHSTCTLSRVISKGVRPRPDTTLAWPGWKQPDIPVEVDTDRLETSRTKAGVLKKLSLAGIAKLIRLKYS
jgi:hypothetical protein